MAMQSLLHMSRDEPESDDDEVRQSPPELGGIAGLSAMGKMESKYYELQTISYFFCYFQSHPGT